MLFFASSKLTFFKFDFYSGIAIGNLWIAQKCPLGCSERLCPKMPFILDGEYENENLYRCLFPTYILVNSNIANQIHMLPEGTPVQIKIVE